MKIKELSVVLLAGILISSTAATLIYSFYYVERVEYYNMSIKVGDVLGFDTTNTSLIFGTVPPGSLSSTRYINLYNYEDHNVIVDIIPKGEMAEWISFSENHVMIVPKMNKTISVSAMIPKGSEKGNYTGKVKVVFKKQSLI